MYEREKNPSCASPQRLPLRFISESAWVRVPWLAPYRRERKSSIQSHKLNSDRALLSPAPIYQLSEREKKKKSEKDNQRGYRNRYLCLYRMEYPVLEPAGVGFNSYRFGRSYNSSENLHWIGPEMVWMSNRRPRVGGRCTTPQHCKDRAGLWNAPFAKMSRGVESPRGLWYTTT